jgi:hypothetical protein
MYGTAVSMNGCSRFGLAPHAVFKELVVALERKEGFVLI